MASFNKLDTVIVAIHCEGSPAGTMRLAKAKKFKYSLVNDDRLNVVDDYSVTSTYLIDKDGIIRARWFDRIHERVGSVKILEAIEELGKRRK